MNTTASGEWITSLMCLDTNETFTKTSCIWNFGADACGSREYLFIDCVGMYLNVHVKLNKYWYVLRIP